MGMTEAMGWKKAHEGRWTHRVDPEFPDVCWMRCLDTPPDAPFVVIEGADFKAGEKLPRITWIYQGEPGRPSKTSKPKHARGILQVDSCPPHESEDPEGRGGIHFKGDPQRLLEELESGSSIQLHIHSVDSRGIETIEAIFPIPLKGFMENLREGMRRAKALRTEKGPKIDPGNAASQELTL